MNLWGEPILSTILAGGYLGLLAMMWGLLLIGVPLWGARWRIVPPEEEPPEEGPWLSVCIPARNESANIEAAVRAALQIRWPSLEVIVVDDRSEDGTGALARAAGEGDPRLRVIEGAEPQPGWAGKPWACARAAGEARGELLLFLDADVCVHPDAPRALVKVLDEDGLGMLSVFGTWELVTFWERALVPAVGWLIRGAVDLDHINDAGRPEAFANGQLILFDRKPYEKIGGHAAVRDQILEDVRIAEAV
ncbi:MAG: chlorobactene glucosyltransferase, partial [Myxococcota bacterium]